MKKILIALVLVLPVFSGAQMSSKKISLSIQGGYSSSRYLEKNSHKQLVSETETRHHKCIVFNTQLEWSVSSKWGVGTSFTYDHFGTKQRSIEYSNVSYMISCRRVWTTTNTLSVYSDLEAGITKIRKFEEEIETQRKTDFAFQINAAGVSYKIVGGLQIYGNIGWGVTGLFSAGARFNFLGYH
jgi:opacity protein-like surface antigen